MLLFQEPHVGTPTQDLFFSRNGLLHGSRLDTLHRRLTQWNEQLALGSKNVSLKTGPEVRLCMNEGSDLTS